MSTLQAIGSGGETSNDAKGRSVGGSSWHSAGIFEPEETESDDIWPLEMWLSREETFVEDDTWHAARTRSLGSQTGGALRSLIAALRRVPPRSSLTA